MTTPDLPPSHQDPGPQPGPAMDSCAQPPEHRSVAQPDAQIDHSQYFYSTSVMEYIVPAGSESAAGFRRWYDQLVATASTYAGYTRSDLCPPLDCGDGVVKWYSIVHFRTPAELNHWLKSGDRQALFEQGRATFLAYRYKSFTTGLEGWFSVHQGGAEQRSLGAPPWKQVLAVVLGLYPTLMVQAMVFEALGLMQGWPMATSLVINNLITSSILTWLVMPRVSRLLSFWLRPAYRQTTLQTHLTGTALVVVALGLMASVFTYLTR